MSKIREAEQRFVGHLAHLANGLQASAEQGIFDASRKSDPADRRVIRKFW
jgi:hypothetical protein